MKNFATSDDIYKEYTAGFPISRIVCVGECRTPYSKEELALYAKLKKLQSDQPKLKARTFVEFSSRIIKVEYSNEAGNCCIRGHDADALFIPWFLRRSQF